MEADFLNRTNFDYSRLWNEEPDFSLGGARVYLTSILPTFLALLMRFLPSGIPIFFVLHLVSIVSTTMICVVLFHLVAQYAGTRVGVLSSLAMLTTPVFSAQTFIVGMELPMAACGILAVWLLCEHRWYLAALFAVAAFLMKASGVVFQLAIITYLVALLMTADREKDKKPSWPVLLFHLACLGAALIVIQQAGSVSNLRTARNQHTASSLFSLPDWSPECLLMFCASLLGTGFLVVRALSEEQSALKNRSAIAYYRFTFGLFLRRYPFWCLAWIALLGGLASLATVPFIPRYLVFILPYLLAVFVFAWARIDSRQVLVTLLLVVFIGLNLINRHGALYPRLIDIYGLELARTGAVIGRSHELIDDHEANLAAMSALEKYSSKQPVIAARPFLDFLAMPELGYFDSQAIVFGANPYPDRFPRIRDISDILDDPPPNPIFIVVGNSWLRLDGLFDIPRPLDEDHVIYSDHLASPLIVFEKRWSGETPSRRELQDWYLDRMWPHERPADRAKFKISFLRERGDLDQAVTEALLAERKDVRDYHLRQLTAAVLFEANRVEEAIEFCLGLSDRDRGRREADYNPVVMARYGPEVELVLSGVPADSASERTYHDALRKLFAGELEQATAILEAGLEQDATSTDAAFALGIIRQHQGQLVQAKALFQSILEQEPKHAAAARRMAEVAMDEGNLDEALEFAKASVREAPENWMTLHTLGTVLARLQEHDSAAQAFERALELNPTDEVARRHLERIRSENPRRESL